MYEGKQFPVVACAVVVVVLVREYRRDGIHASRSYSPIVGTSGAVVSQLLTVRI